MTKSREATPLNKKKSRFFLSLPLLTFLPKTTQRLLLMSYLVPYTDFLKIDIINEQKFVTASTVHLRVHLRYYLFNKFYRNPSLFQKILSSETNSKGHVKN